MATPVENLYVRPTVSDLVPYVYPIQPPLDVAGISSDLLIGTQRRLKTPITGDWSIVVRYRGKEAHVTSVAEDNSDLTVVQFQGARGRAGFRVSAGFLLVNFVADQLLKIAESPYSPYERITMPRLADIIGIEDCSEKGRTRYEQLTRKLGLTFSDQESQYVRDLVKA